MGRTDDGFTRRSFLHLTGGTSVATLGGCLEPFENPPSFESAYTEYLTEPILPTSGSENMPYETALITDRSQLERRLNLEAVSKARADEWQSVDYGTSFLAVFTSGLAILPSGELRRTVISGEMKNSEFAFSVELSECPSSVSELEPEAVQFLLVERWSKSGNPPPDGVTVESAVLPQC